MTGMMKAMTALSKLDVVTELASDDGLQDIFESEAPLTPLILPYAFAKRHGVLIGKIDDDTVDVLHHGSPEPIVLAEISRITRRDLS